MNSPPSLLEIEDLVVRYGRVEALHGISLDVREGEIVAVLGRNGAGKTTLLRAIFGFAPPTSGVIRFAGDDISGTPPHEVARCGVAYVPDDRGIFHDLTVLEVLRLGALPSRVRGDDQLEEIFELFPVLKERASERAGSLSGGQQQMLGLGRALMSKPRLLLLDEPSLGLAPRVVSELIVTLAALASRQLTVLLVEQNVHRALSIASRAYLLDLGRVVLAGQAAAVAADPKLRAAYLSRDAAGTGST